jgi:hypothetical protein
VPITGEPFGCPRDPFRDDPAGRLIVGQADGRDIVIEARGDAGAEWLGWLALAAMHEQDRLRAKLASDRAMK